MPVLSGSKSVTAVILSSTVAQKPRPPTAVSLAPVIPPKYVELVIASVCITPVYHLPLLRKLF